MKFSGLAILALVMLCVPVAKADPVHLGVGGRELGPTPLFVGEGKALGFDLAADTQITSLQFEIIPGFDGFGSFGTISVTLTGADVSYSWLLTDGWRPCTTTVTLGCEVIPSFLPAGGYSVEFQGISCTDPCVGGEPASLTFYEPATYTEIGGTVSRDPYGFNLVGNTVPEPSSIALFGTGMAGLMAFTRRRIRTAS